VGVFMRCLDLCVHGCDSFCLVLSL
jgi:hypothetical protein